MDIQLETLTNTIKKYLKENDDSNPYIYEVVDGQERIRTILKYTGVKPTDKNVYRGDWEEPYSSLPETPIAKGRAFSQLNADQQTVKKC
ncbi:hypothetical protein SCALIN_C36_0023 [Candidatus Scalindua japonica]|uniref:Uncharacterized protein n=1 Tax=Candidatus Scalindua japonica TaxID=1284222 RepID=A0A286U3D2_9BACT|nr:hypothetical protein [Candidatus Scalindua japonica]GAX62634.1 hypothetical protein SCALIN_C36_0023 [Candidatus Scalindua japonica]